MARSYWKVLSGLAVGAVLTLVVVQAQQKPTPTLTALDYVEIMQLANKYPYILPTCDGNGYAYADQFSDDGTFIDLWSNNGVKEGGIRWQGRDKLAEVAGAGPLECNKTGLVHYFTVNHVITPLPDGTARGVVYTLAGGGNGDPDMIKKNDPYEDIYVKTAKGWKFKQRAHVRDKARKTGVYTEGVYPLDDPRGPAKGDPRKRKATK